MRLRRSKILFTGLVIFSLCYFSLNYVNIVNRSAIPSTKDALVQKFERKMKKTVVLLSKQLKVDESNSEKKRYFAHDGGGFGSINSGKYLVLYLKMTKVQAMQI